LFTPSQIAQQLDGEEKEIWRIIEDEPVMPELQGLASKNEASWLELNIYMQNQLLRDADVMSMAHGVEIRIPFLDPQVIRTAMALGKQKKFAGPRPKQTLINAFMDELPDATWNRKKMGFSFPFTEWMQNSEFIRDTMQGGARASRTSYEKFEAGKLHWSHLMSMMLYEMKAA
jgi:asparagine synthase (glutamine-hydrolysing)